MSEIVIDASAALALVLTSQSTGASRSFLAPRDSESFIAPYIFTWEVANVLARLARRGPLRQEALKETRADLRQLEIAFQAPPDDAETWLIAEKASAFGLRVFGAAYLLLAMERRCALASRDDRLLVVARRFVPCLDLQGDSPV